MKRIAVVLSLILLVVFAVTVQTQNQKPTPPPEMKNYEVYLGDWTIAGKIMETPYGPADNNYSGKVSFSMILNGFFVECKGLDKDFEGIEIYWYDTVTKTYPYFGIVSNGSAYSGLWTLKEHDWLWSETIIHNGIKYMNKGVNIFNEDRTIFTQKAEFSSDGKTWKPWRDVIFTKVKSIK